MSTYGYLKLLTKEMLSIDGKDGLNEGKPLAAFLTMYRAYIRDGKKYDDFQLFVNLEKDARTDLRILVDIIDPRTDELTDEQIELFILDSQKTNPYSPDEIRRAYSREKNLGKYLRCDRCDGLK